MKDIILYKDRNTKDIRINDGLNSLHKCLINNYNNFKFNNFNKYEESKIAIVWGIYCKTKSDTRYRKLIYDNQYTKNNKTLIIEVGFLKRDKYYSLGWNSIVNFGQYNNHNMSSDRWDKLNIEIKNNKINNNGYILLCGQVPWDTQLQHINYKKWIYDIVQEIKKYTSRQIVYRPHPKQSPKNNMAILNIPDTINSVKKNLYDDFKESFVVVSLNSNSLLEALIEGIPIFAFDKGSPIYDIANQDLSNIENPKFPEDDIKKQKLHDIAYMQWNKEELENGEALNHILKNITR